MRSERAGPILFLLAAMAAAAPPAQARGRVIWIEMCDSLHPGRKIPLPLDGDGHQPAQACHAACGIVASRRDAGRRHA